MLPFTTKMGFSRKKTYTPLLGIPGIPYGVNQKEPGFMGSTVGVQIFSGKAQFGSRISAKFVDLDLV